MNYLFSAALLLHVACAIGIIGLVLVQHGKGADMGAAFGSGASGSLFGATGAANFLSRATAVLAAIFFVTSLSLGYMVSNRPKATGSLLQDAVKSQPALDSVISSEKVVAPLNSDEKSSEGVPK